MMEDKTNDHINKLSPDDLLQKVIEMLTQSSSQELFSAINENPGSIDELSKSQIFTESQTRIILDILSDYDKRLQFKNALDALSLIGKDSSLEHLAKSIATEYHEYSSDNSPLFSEQKERDISCYSETGLKEYKLYQESFQEIYDSANATIGNPCPWRISALVNEQNSLPMSKFDIIHTLIKRVLIDMLECDPKAKDNLKEKNSTAKIKELLKSFTPDHLQHKIYDDFKNLKEWQKKILYEVILKGYAKKSQERAGKLYGEEIRNFTILHRNMLAELVKSYQRKGSPEDSFYYLNGLRDNHIVISTEKLGPREHFITDKELLDEISLFSKDWDERDPIDKLQENILKQRKDVLTKKIEPFVGHMVYANNLGMSELLPDHRTDSIGFIESSGSFAIPIKVTGIDPDMKQKLFKKFYPGDSLEGGWFDVGYLVRKSNIEVKDGVVSIASGISHKSGVYPVILCNNAAVIVHSLPELREVAANSRIKNAIPVNSSPLADQLANMLHAMFLDKENNIFSASLIEGTQASKKTKYKKDYPDTDSE